MSGMAQATAVQALSRAAVALDAPRYARLARRALGAFETPPPAGVAVPTAGGRRYVMYSFAPSLQILNGELQAINGLRDAAVLGHSGRAARLVARGDRAARAALGGFDTGAWSLYSAAGSESTLAYHQLTTGILAELCRRTERVAYCRAERRFARYETEPPRVGIAPLRGLRARRGAPLHFTLSKGSAVRVRVFGPRGLVLARDMQLDRGGHDLSWTPPSRGRFRVRVSARGPEGRLGVKGGPYGWCSRDRSRSRSGGTSRAGRRRSGWARPTRRDPAASADREGAAGPARNAGGDSLAAAARAPARAVGLRAPARRAAVAVAVLPQGERTSTPRPCSSPSSAANLATSRAWSSSTNVIPTPLAPARAVRPVRWM